MKHITIEQLAKELPEHSIAAQISKPTRVYIPDAEIAHAAEAMRLLREVTYWDTGRQCACHGDDFPDVEEGNIPAIGLTEWYIRDREMRA